MSELEQLESELKNIDYVIDSLEYKVSVQEKKRRFIQDQIMGIEVVSNV